MYDCIIIGAGVIGASIARYLAKYKLDVLVLEKENDVGDGTSKANSAIVHSGYDPHIGTLKAKYNVLGNKMFPQVCEELDVEFDKIGSLTIATKEEQLPMLEELCQNGLSNGVDVRIVDKDELFQMEPFVTKNALKALWAKDAGIVNPFELVVALMENAMDNGVELHLEEEVIGIKKNNDIYEVETNKANYQTKVVINAAGLYSDKINNMYFNDDEKITPRRGQYFVLDHFKMPYVKHTLFSLPSDLGKGVLVSPTTHGNYLIGPSSDFVSDKDDVGTTNEVLNHVLEQAKLLVDDLHLDQVIREFSGNRAYHNSGDFVINMKEKGFINLVGIQSPGLVSSLAIGKDIVESFVSNCLGLQEKENYNPRRRPLYRMNKLTIEERNELIKKNPELGIIVCRCEKVSLGEIKDAIERNCGARTIKGVKKRVRPGFGKCQGSFCEPLVASILAKYQKDIHFGSEKEYVFPSSKGGKR